MEWARDTIRYMRKQDRRVVRTAGSRTRGRSWLHGTPDALFLHHTAGAATSSTDPDHPGNQPGANSGVVAWVQHASSAYPWANATLDRDGTLYWHSDLSAWHSGIGSFTGTQWGRLGIPDNGAHLATWGLEVVSKGLAPDFTREQKRTLDALMVGMRLALGWDGWRYRLPQHKDWAPARKVDTLYSQEWVLARAQAAWKAQG